MQVLIALITGMIMAFGLALSGMANPKRVIGFLDIAGDFDPTLIFVMAGALFVAVIGFRLARRNARPVLGNQFDTPTVSKITLPLIAGAMLFGAGWGLAGFCPAPAIVGVGLGEAKAVIFVGTMLLGMGLSKAFLVKK